MTSYSEISAVARNLLRDFGTFFEVNFAGNLNTTLRLPHPLVDPEQTTVVNNTNGDPVTDVAINARSGLLRLGDPASLEDGVTVTGMYYQWFLPEDLTFHASVISAEHLHNRTGVSLDSIVGTEVEVLGIGAVVSALMALLSELAVDIDVITPEGVNIPAHQRYQQVLQLFNYWSTKYDEKSALLNVGLKRIEMLTLRRISRTTNRYVPLYRGREIDDPRRPVRVRPPIDPIATTPLDSEMEYWESQYNDAEGGSFDLAGGWESLGSSGV